MQRIRPIRADGDTSPREDPGVGTGAAANDVARPGLTPGRAWRVLRDIHSSGGPARGVSHRWTSVPPHPPSVVNFPRPGYPGSLHTRPRLYSPYPLWDPPPGPLPVLHQLPFPPLPLQSLRLRSRLGLSRPVTCPLQGASRPGTLSNKRRTPPVLFECTPTQIFSLSRFLRPLRHPSKDLLRLDLFFGPRSVHDPDRVKPLPSQTSSQSAVSLSHHEKLSP